MKTFLLSLLVVFIRIFAVQAQTVISLPEVDPPSKVDHITDQAVFADSAVDAHVIWAAPGFKKNRIGAPVHEQIFVLKGKLRFTLNGKSQKLTPGHWVILPANTPHTLEVLGNETVKLLAVQDKSTS